jgi:hypothetical protein
MNILELRWLALPIFRLPANRCFGILVWISRSASPLLALNKEPFDSSSSTYQRQSLELKNDAGNKFISLIANLTY